MEEIINNEYNFESSKDLILKHLNCIFNDCVNTKTQLENVKENSDNIQTKLVETEKDMESFSRVSLLRKMSDQISQKNNDIKFLEKRIETMTLKIKKLEALNKEKNKLSDGANTEINESENFDDNENHQNNKEEIDGFKKILIKEKEYLLDVKTEKIYNMNNISECLGKLHINSKGENQLRKKKVK